MNEPCPVRYYDESGEPHDGLAIEVNGNLVWVEDAGENAFETDNSMRRS